MAAGELDEGKDGQGENAESGGFGGGGGGGFCEEEVVHGDNVVVGVAEHAIGEDGVDAGGDADASDLFAVVGDGAEEGLALVSSGEDVVGEDEVVGLIEELDGGGVRGFDVSEDGGEGGGGGGGVGAGEEEGDVGDVAADGGEDARCGLKAAAKSLAKP